jgi:hypothetical protein
MSENFEHFINSILYSLSSHTLSMDPSSCYDSLLLRLRSALQRLPSTLPFGSTVYEFTCWLPDSDLLEEYGAECSVLNAYLERRFGLRASTPLIFLERGPGIESIVDLFSRY